MAPSPTSGYQRGLGVRPTISYAGGGGGYGPPGGYYGGGYAVHRPPVSVCRVMSLDVKADAFARSLGLSCFSPVT